MLRKRWSYRSRCGVEMGVERHRNRGFIPFIKLLQDKNAKEIRYDNFYRLKLSAKLKRSLLESNVIANVFET